MSRAEYMHEYYLRTKSRRRLLANHREQMKCWTRWLLAELTNCGLLTGSYSVDSNMALDGQQRPGTGVMSAHGYRNKHRDDCGHSRGNSRSLSDRFCSGTKRTLRVLERAVVGAFFKQYHVAPLHAEQRA